MTKHKTSLELAAEDGLERPGDIKVPPGIFGIWQDRYRDYLMELRILRGIMPTDYVQVAQAVRAGQASDAAREMADIALMEGDRKDYIQLSNLAQREARQHGQILGTLGIRALDRVTKKTKEVSAQVPSEGGKWSDI